MSMLLGDFVDDACALDVEAFAKKHARFFLTCSDPDSLSPLSGPQATAQLSSDLLRLVLESGNSPNMIAIPICRKSDSAFRFISVGRTANCDVVIPDTSVSKLQAIIREDDDGGLTIQDAGSANGTFVDDEVAPTRNDNDPTPIRN